MLQDIANEIRRLTFWAIAEAGGGHFGGSLSCIEILTAMYFSVMQIDPADPDWLERDRFVLSKGHSGPALYCTLAKRGFFPVEYLRELDKNGTALPKHADRKVKGVEISTGSLGQGLSYGCGMALAAKIDKKGYFTYVLLGEGECNSGQIWEAAMTASKYQLDNLIAVVDRNRLQIDGSNEEVMPLEPFLEKWTSFGWEADKVDGHDIEAIREKLLKAKTSSKPAVIIADTIKGKGISFMEDALAWHSSKIDTEQYKKGKIELGIGEDL